MHHLCYNQSVNLTELNLSCFELAYYDSPAIRGIMCVLYALIFLVGSSGNFLVCFVVCRNSSMYTVTNIFITNLAVSDLCMCFLAIPFTPIDGYMDTWVFGRVMCHIIPMVAGVSVFVSTLTLTAIAIDRYIVICFPFKVKVKMWLCLLVICLIWIASISFSLPLGYFTAVTKEKTCEEFWPDNYKRKMYTTASFFVQFFVPLTFIAFCYTSIYFKVRSQTKKTAGLRSSVKERQEAKRRDRMNKMLIAMVAIFASCWFPINVLHIMVEYCDACTKWPYFFMLFMFVHVWAVSSTCYNPLLYAWLNENFRKEFTNVLPCFISEGRRRGSMVPTCDDGPTFSQNRL